MCWCRPWDSRTGGTCGKPDCLPKVTNAGTDQPHVKLVLSEEFTPLLRGERIRARIEIKVDAELLPALFEGETASASLRFKRAVPANLDPEAFSNVAAQMLKSGGFAL